MLVLQRISDVLCAGVCVCLQLLIMSLTDQEINQLLFQPDLDGEESVDSSSSDEFYPVQYENPEPDQIENSSIIEEETSSDLTCTRKKARSYTLPSVPKIKRKVCSIESALNPENYTLLPMDEEETRYTSVLVKKTRTTPAKNISWSSIPPPSSRVTAENILPSQPLVKCNLVGENTPFQCWTSFFSDGINKRMQAKIELARGNRSLHYKLLHL